MKISVILVETSHVLWFMMIDFIDDICLCIGTMSFAVNQQKFNEIAHMIVNFIFKIIIIWEFLSDAVVTKLVS